MIKAFIRCGAITLDIIGLAFTIAPEEIFTEYKLLEDRSDAANIILNRVLVIVIVFLLVAVVYGIISHIFRYKVIKRPNYIISVEYGNLLKKRNCKKIVHFDECLITKMGEGAPYIQIDSLCGQFLNSHNMDESDMRSLIVREGLVPAAEKSRFESRARYESGKLLKYDKEFLIMPFAKLDERGRACMPTRKEYLDCLSLLWKEIDTNYGSTDVCVAILGAGRTIMFNDSLTAQNLLDMMISSYILSDYKIKPPHRLRIVFWKNDDIALDKVPG